MGTRLPTRPPASDRTGMGYAMPVALGLAFLFILATGCTTTAPFYYSYPEEAPESASNFVLSLAPIRDVRKDKSLDDVYESEPQAMLDRILEREMRSTSLFADVSAVGAGERRADSGVGSAEWRLVLNGKLQELSWEVPGYDNKMTAAFVLGFLTGGIGGIIYGSIPTDVYGKAAMEFELANEDTGTVVFKQRFIGSYEERMSKFSCGTPETKSRMAGEALADAITQLKVDLGGVLHH